MFTQPIGSMVLSGFAAGVCASEAVGRALNGDWTWFAVLIALALANGACIAALWRLER